MAKYIGITLGPIGDTMSLTSTPAGLWAASYLFSFLAHEIRRGIGKEGLLQDDYEYKPGFTVRSLYEKGVGLYHDRIIYEADEIHDLDNAYIAVKNAVDTVIDGFAVSDAIKTEKANIKDFFERYLNIHIVCMDIEDNENFLFKINDVLDAAELEKSFPTVLSQKNPVLALFEGKEDNRNAAIKTSFLMARKNDNVIMLHDSERRIKDLPSIAAAVENSPYKNNEKALRYYAVIRADGDNMGAAIKKITNEADYHDFSRRCFDYGCKTAETVLRYCGIPIYVGGDDLLCISPLMVGNKDEEALTFLDMIREIRDGFKQIFPEGDLSFGVQIQYVKAPLYEALDRSGGLLFGTAKSNKPGAVAINIQKHSGQSAETLMKYSTVEGEKVCDQVNRLIKMHASEETLKSVGKHISDFSVLFNCAGQGGEDKLENFFKNVFDNGVSDSDRNYLNKINTLANLIINAAESEKRKIDPAEEIGAYIRLIKFFSEKLIDEEEAVK